jgi:hypothetical protein
MRRVDEYEVDSSESLASLARELGLTVYDQNLTVHDLRKLRCDNCGATATTSVRTLGRRERVSLCADCRRAR